MSTEIVDQSLRLALNFYNDVLKYVIRHALIPPVEIDFSNNPAYSTDAGDTLQMQENLTFYGKVIDIFDCIAYDSDETLDVANADDVNDPDWMDCHYYVSSVLTNDIPFLLIKNAHPWIFPDMLNIYGPTYQINISCGTADISVYPINANVRNAFLNTDPIKRRSAIIDYLCHTDRPSYVPK